MNKDKNGNTILNWKEFFTLPLIGVASRMDAVFHVEHGNEIVSFVKSISRTIGIMRIGGEGRQVDFMGCSPDYVLSKIDAAINDLKWIKQRVKELDKEQRHAKKPRL